jgi:hypothetical protein
MEKGCKVQKIVKQYVGEKNGDADPHSPFTFTFKPEWLQGSKLVDFPGIPPEIETVIYTWYL